MLERWHALAPAARREILCDVTIAAAFVALLVAAQLVDPKPSARRDFAMMAAGLLILFLFWPVANHGWPFNAGG